MVNKSNHCNVNIMKILKKPNVIVADINLKKTNVIVADINLKKTNVIVADINLKKPCDNNMNETITNKSKCKMY